MTLLHVKNLSLSIAERQLVKRVSFTINPGECLGLVGESGCGKTLLAQSILLPKACVDEGEILFQGENLLAKTAPELRKIRGGKIGMIFQEPMTSLNPLMTVGDQIIETLQIHKRLSKKEARQEAKALLASVGISESQLRIQQYPFEFSGGMQQRVMIAMAIACKPLLLIADEPTTALDVTLQAEILHLLAELQKEMGLGILFISHDLGVVAKLCKRVLVMHKGSIVEEGVTSQIFESPAHPYTQQLLLWRRKK